MQGLSAGKEFATSRIRDEGLRQCLGSRRRLNDGGESAKDKRVGEIQQGRTITPQKQIFYEEQTWRQWQGFQGVATCGLRLVESFVVSRGLGSIGKRGRQGGGSY